MIITDPLINCHTFQPLTSIFIDLRAPNDHKNINTLDHLDILGVHKYLGCFTLLYHRQVTLATFQWAQLSCDAIARKTTNISYFGTRQHQLIREQLGSSKSVLDNTIGIKINTYNTIKCLVFKLVISNINRQSLAYLKPLQFCQSLTSYSQFNSILFLRWSLHESHAPRPITTFRYPKILSLWNFLGLRTNFIICQNTLIL